MRKIAQIFMLVCLALAFSLAAVNAQIQVTDTFDKDNPTFGSSNQEASNPEHDDVAKHNIFEPKKTINVQNTGATSITIDAISVNPASGFTTSDLQITFLNPAPVTVAAGSTGTIDLTARIPEQLDAVDTDFEKFAFIVGTVTFLDASNNVGSFQVFMERENKLELTDMDAIVNGKGRQSIDTGDDLENLKPGDRVELETEASNEFDDRTNLDIEDVDLSIACDDESDFDFDDKTEEIGDIGPEDEETETITFDVEDDAKDGSNKCDVSVGGRDENGAFHGENRNFGVDVERQNHDIVIRNLNANPSSLSCDDSTMEVRVEYVNLGRSNEDRVAVEVTSKLLGYQDRISGFELDEDDTEESTFLIPVDPRQIKQGPIAIQVQTFYDNTKTSDSGIINIENLCAEGEPAPTGGTPRPTGPTPTTTNALVISSETIGLDVGSLASIPVKIINQEETAVEYTLSLTNIEEFAETASSKKVFLNPGQESTVFMNLKAKSDVPAGLYSGTITLRDQAGSTLQTETFTVEITGEAAGEGLNFDFLTGDSNSRIFWIIGDIILIIVAIFFIKLIFTGGRRRKAAAVVPKAAKKMADYEAEAARKR